MPIRLPQVQQQPYQAPEFQARGVVPVQDVTSGLIQEQGEGLQRLGATFAKIGAIEQDKLNDTKAMHGTVAAADEIRGIRTEYQTLQGSNAVDARQATIDRIEAAIKAKRDALENDSQRAIFDRQMMERRFDSLRVVETHYRQSLDTAEQATYEGVAKTNGRDYVANYDPAAVDGTGPFTHDKYYGAAVRAAHDRADKLGLDESGRRLLVQETTTDMHVGVTANLIAQDPEKATRYLDSKQGEMDPKAVTILRKQIASAMSEGGARLRAAQIDAVAAPVAGALFDQGATSVQVEAWVRQQVALHKQSPSQGFSQEVGDEIVKRVRTLRDDAYTERRRALQETADTFEQRFVEDEKLSPESLPPEEQATLRERGLWGVVKETGRKVRLQRVADRLERDPEAVILDRDVQSISDIEKLLELLDTRIDDLTQGDAGKDPKNAEKAKRLQARRDQYEATVEELALKPRAYVPEKAGPVPPGSTYEERERAVMDRLKNLWRK